MTPLQRLAAEAGLALRWRDAFGKPQIVQPDTLRAVLNALGLPCATPAQLRASRALLQHRPSPVLVTVTAGATVTVPRAGRAKKADFALELEDGDTLAGKAIATGDGWRVPPIRAPGYHRLTLAGQALQLAVAPPRCWTLADACGERRPRRWGLAAQLYALRGRRDGGIGDFAALAELVRAAAARGADALAISPVHAMFAAAPERRSPYSPSSRRFYNVLHAAAGDDESSDGELIDWPRAAARRLHALRRLPVEDADSLRRFRMAGGEALENHARFEALTFRYGADWRRWPQALRNPRGAEVAKFARAHAASVTEHVVLQWRAAQGLATAQSATRRGGMALGLITDLAVGTDPAGSDAWSDPDEVLSGVSVGAPPDAINLKGQGWGLTALSPRGLREQGYAAFIAALRAALVHAGGVRIDHVMGLMRLWLVPDGAEATQGVYLAYPFDDLMRLVALESWRHRAIVIGEDLGTVPEGFRERIAAAGMLGMRVLWFERAGARFRAPRAWSRDAVALTSTHDVASVAGWWSGNDLAWRARAGQLPPAATLETERTARARERAELERTLRLARVKPGPPAVRAAEFIGKSAAPLAILPLEDALGLTEQPNLPGTVDEHPNWRRRYPPNTAARLRKPPAALATARLDRARRMR